MILSSDEGTRLWMNFPFGAVQGVGEQGSVDLRQGPFELYLKHFRDSKVPPSSSISIAELTPGWQVLANSLDRTPSKSAESFLILMPGTGATKDVNNPVSEGSGRTGGGRRKIRWQISKTCHLIFGTLKLKL